MKIYLTCVHVTKRDLSEISERLRKIQHGDGLSVFDKYGRMGVNALSAATPIDTGVTSRSWYYTIKKLKNNAISLRFHNSNRNKGISIAILIQYGHGTGTGGWVEGIDYINPALRPVFKQMADELWKESMHGRGS